MEKARIRKDGIKKGKQTTKMMTFRCDLDALEILQQVKNKGRLINDLIRNWGRTHREPIVDYAPEENDIPMSDE